MKKNKLTHLVLSGNYSTDNTELVDKLTEMLKDGEDINDVLTALQIVYRMGVLEVYKQYTHVFNSKQELAIDSIRDMVINNKEVDV